MNKFRFYREDYLLWEAIVCSLILHMLLLHSGDWQFHPNAKHPVEIDITRMAHVGMARSAWRAAPPAPKPVVRAKEWVKPKPEQKAIPAPVPTKPVPALEPETPAPPAPTASAEAAPAEYAIGGAEANVLSRLPQLKNLADLDAILRRFYPEEARARQVGALVVLDIHIDRDGEVTSADIVRSGGSDFDAAARKAAMLLRFTPAFLGSQRVAVRMRQSIQFKLEN